MINLTLEEIEAQYDKNGNFIGLSGNTKDKKDKITIKILDKKVIDYINRKEEK